MLRRADGRFSSSTEEVSARMRSIRSEGTKPELRLFAVLSERCVPHLRHPRVCGVRVDALVNENTIVFVDSPFWHLRDRKTLERLSPYWRERLLVNRRRDRAQDRILRAAGWRVVRVWADQVGEPRTLRRIGAAATRPQKTRAATPR
jgi:DNA mismatch endonuclease, patch repair protein